MFLKSKFSLMFMIMLVISVILAGCGGNQTSQNESTGDNADQSEKTEKTEKTDKVVIGVALPDFDDKWLSYLQDSMREYDESEPGFEGIYVDAMNDAAKQMNQVENFITQGVDAIAIIPVDTVSALTMVERANDAGIPMVVINRVFPEIDLATAYVGGNSIDSGIIQMEAVVELLGGKGNVAIMNGELGHEAALKRTEGNKQVAAEYEGIEIVLENTAKWDRAQGLTLMENWLQSGQQIDAVVANNDEMAIGAIMALEAAGKLDDVIVAGIDGTIDALEYVKTGALDVSVFQDPFQQGSKGLEVAYRAAKGEKVEKMNFIPFELINKDNYETYVEKWQ